MPKRVVGIDNSHEIKITMTSPTEHQSGRPFVVRFTLIITALVLLTVVCLSLLTIRRERQLFQTELQGQAQLILDTLAAAAKESLPISDVEALTRLVAPLEESPAVVAAYIYNEQGTRLVGFEAVEETEGSSGATFRQSDTVIINWQPDRLLAGQTVREGEQSVGAVQVGLSTSDWQARVIAIIMQGVMVALVALLLGILAAWSLSRSVSGPLQDLIDAARRIGQGDMRQEIAAVDQKEIGLLAAEMEQMRAALHTLYADAEAQAVEQTQALQAREKLLHQIYQTVSDHIYVSEYTQQGERINHFISPVENLTGYPLEKFETDWSFWAHQVIHPDDRVLAAAQAERFEQGLDSEIEYRLVKADGSIIWVRDSGRIEKDSETGSIFVYGVVSNITERIQIQQALQEKQAEFEAIFQAIPDAVIFVDTQRRIKLINPAVTAQYEYTSGELVGTTKDLLYSNQEVQEGISPGWYNLSDAERQQPREINYRRKSGELFIGEVVGRAVSDVAGNTLGYVMIVRDITERKLAERALAEARDQALEANRLKSELLARVSHELRTPLGAILGYSQLLELGTFGSLSEQQLNTLQEIIGSTRTLGKLVDELLDQAKFDVGSVKLQMKPFELLEMVNHVKAQMNILANAKGLTLTATIADSMPKILSGDQHRLQQILVNLVGNAIKFTPSGTINIHFYLADQDHWSFQISDTGPGIPQEAQAYIFEPFRQLDGSLTRHHGGAGLGLSIVKQLVLLMGGEISLESQLGQGSTFTVILPLTPTALNISDPQLPILATDPDSPN